MNNLYKVGCCFLGLLFLAIYFIPNIYPGLNEDYSGVDEMAPAFVVTTLTGEEINLSDFRGRPVIIWFMATWCPSCRIMGDVISRVALDREVEVIVVDVWTDNVIKKFGLSGATTIPSEDGDKLRDFVSQYASGDWNLVLDLDGRLTELFGVRNVDTVVVISADGRVVFRSVGPIPENVLSDALDGSLDGISYDNYKSANRDFSCC